MPTARKAQPPTRIINRGRFHSYLLDGQKANGVTTLIGAGLPKPQIIDWTGRTVAETAVEQRDVWENMAPGAAIEWLKAAPRNDRDLAANRGTQVHALAEQLASGKDVEVPPELAGHVDSYIAFLEEWTPTDVLLELVVINRKWSYMGRLDMIATLFGERWLLDVKTSRSGVFAETALQLAAYRFAETAIDPVDKTREIPMPKVDRCGAIWVRGDGYDVYPYEAGEPEFREFLYVAQVAEFMWRTGKDKIGAVRHDPIFPPPVEGS